MAKMISSEFTYTNTLTKEYLISYTKECYKKLIKLTPKYTSKFSLDIVFWVIVTFKKVLDNPSLYSLRRLTIVV